MKLTYIEWQDAHSLVEGWHDEEEINKFSKSNDFIVKNVGWIRKRKILKV